MAKKKKKSNTGTKVHIKKGVKSFAIFLILIIVLGLIFMNLAFTSILVLGILFIMWLSKIFDKKKKKKWFRILINSLAIFILLCAIAGIGGIVWFFNYVITNAPEFNEDALSMSQSTKIYDANGVQIAELGTQKREIIKYNDLNDVLVDALVATEDSRFFQHNGFDAPRFLVASVKQAVGNSDAGGASTITMQVAKNSYNAEKANVTSGFEGIVRKFTDIYMAVFKIEKNYSKQEIIEFYLNNHFLGNNAYGVEQGALTYFNKHANQLNLAEASLLIGLFQAPSAYNPYKNAEAATERRKDVLYLMLHHGYITKEEYEIANAIPVESLLESQKVDQKYLSYLDTVTNEAEKKYGVNPNTSSLLIYTNMNSDYQQVLDDIMYGKTYTWENPVVKAGIAIVDINTGKILAIGGNRDQDGDRLYNYATMTKRQIGSTAKPIFDYGPGIEFNNWSTGKLFDDSKYYYSSGQQITNSDGGYMGIMTLRNALAQSRNIPALKAFQQVDNSKIYDFAVSLGMDLEEESINSKYLHEAYSIGSFNGSNPLKMAAAYAAFGNGGYYYEPYTITKIVFRDTGEVLTNESEKKQVMSSATAYMITDCLKTAVNSGASTVAKINGVNIAGKTGTTNHNTATLYKYGIYGSAINDAWVIGYDTKVSVAIWYGYEPISSEYWTTPNSAYAQRKNLFSAVGNKVFIRDGSDFAAPSTVVKLGVEYNPDVNAEPKLPSESTPQDKIIYEWFKKGTEPTEVSTRYQRFADSTGLTAKYDPSTMSVTLNWNPIAMPTDLFNEYGGVGYKIYKDGAYLGYSASATYTVNNVTDPNGTYRVSTGYEKYSGMDSLGVTYKLSYTDPNKYESSLNVPNESKYTIGDNLQSYDLNPSNKDVTFTKNGTKTDATIKVSIQNSNGDNVSNITTSAAQKYTVTYSITYNNYKNTLKRTVIVETKKEPEKTDPEKTE